jgi:hypothetical protein
MMNTGEFSDNFNRDAVSKELQSGAAATTIAALAGASTSSPRERWSTCQEIIKIPEQR